MCGISGHNCTESEERWGQILGFWNRDKKKKLRHPESDAGCEALIQCGLALEHFEGSGGEEFGKVVGAKVSKKMSF